MNGSIVSTYPTVQQIANISKETTSRELSKMEGIEETTQRMVGINLSAGYVNAVEICCGLYRAPSMDQLLAKFRDEVLPKSRAKPEMMSALKADLAESQLALPSTNPLIEIGVQDVSVVLDDDMNVEGLSDAELYGEVGEFLESVED